LPVGSTSDTLFALEFNAETALRLPRHGPAPPVALPHVSMKIVACIKRVPATETQAKVAAGGKGLEPAGVEYMLSFYDELAVEEALRTKEKLGAGEVIVLTLGPSEARKEVIECLAKGADRGIVLVDPNWSARDARSTAKLLAAKIQELGADLVFTGRVATDTDSAAVGPMIATLLGYGCVTDVVKFSVAGTNAQAERESEAGIENYAVALPAVITCQKGLNEPRYAGLKGIMAAKKKPLEEAAIQDVANQIAVERAELPAPRKEGRIVGTGAAAVPALIEALRKEAQLL
jgi:electron transfer flavoprotein beta subunit